MSVQTTDPRCHLRRSIRRIAGIAALSALSGCAMTSPYWNQSFTSHTAAIPIQTWTFDSTQVVKVECAQAYHGGTYPPFENPTWVLVSNISPQTTGALDPKAAVVYGAGVSTPLPPGCWRQDPGNGIWYAAVRATQASGSGGTSQFTTFDITGLECLGREVGKGASWTAWTDKNCAMTYSGSTQTIPFAIIWSSS
jgi:hypothetical protein